MIDLYVYVSHASFAEQIGISIAADVSTSNSYQRNYSYYLNPQSYLTPQLFNEAVLETAKDLFEEEFGVGYVDGELFLIGALRTAASETTLYTAEIDIGTVARFGGSFDIAGSGWVTGKPVYMQQAPGPYTGKGTLADEAEMDLITCTGSVVDQTTIRCYWTCSPKGGPVKGSVKFFYAVSG